MVEFDKNKPFTGVKDLSEENIVINEVLEYKSTEISDLLENKADPSNIFNLIETIAIAPRPAGSERQIEVAEFCFDLLKTYGYEVELQEYPFKMLSVQEISIMTNAPFDFSTDTDMTGVNVIAKKTGTNSNDKTIVVSTSIDSLSTNNGVTDNATGMSAVLELANMLQNVPTDVDIVFALFSGDNNASYGARYYVSQLEQNELDKMININIDTIGEKGTTYPQLGTIDGISNEVTDLLSDYISDVTKGGLSNYIAFEYADVPTVSIIQYPEYPNNIETLNGDAEVDVDKVVDVTNMLYAVITSK